MYVCTYIYIYIYHTHTHTRVYILCYVMLYHIIAYHVIVDQSMLIPGGLRYSGKVQILHDEGLVLGLDYGPGL